MGILCRLRGRLMHRVSASGVHLTALAVEPVRVCIGLRASRKRQREKDCYITPEDFFLMVDRPSGNCMSNHRNKTSAIVTVTKKCLVMHYALCLKVFCILA